MSFLSEAVPRDLPVEGYMGWVATHKALRVNFLHRHVRDTVVVLEELSLPHPWCPRYYMMVLLVALNGCHTTNAQFSKGVDRKWRRVVA